MKNTVFFLLLSMIFYLVGCVNNVEEPKIDCSTSDLSLKVKSFVKAGCEDLGSVTLEALGGSGNYSFSVDGNDFQSSATIENLTAGNFTFFVMDDECTVSKSFTLEAVGNAISLSVAVTNSDCDTDNGVITATASGGVGTLQYSLNASSFQESSNFDNLAPGDYELIVKDEQSCEVMKDVKVESNVSLSEDITPIISANCAISGCHNGSVSPNLSSSTSIVNNSNRIKSRTSAGTMPPSSRPDLSSAEIDIIACWVDGGAKDN